MRKREGRGCASGGGQAWGDCQCMIVLGFGGNWSNRQKAKISSLNLEFFDYVAKDGSLVLPQVEN